MYVGKRLQGNSVLKLGCFAYPIRSEAGWLGQWACSESVESCLWVENFYVLCVLIQNILLSRDEDAPAKIADENAVKPEGWLDDEPEYVPDPDAEKPEDWYVYCLLQMTADISWLGYWLLQVLEELFHCCLLTKLLMLQKLVQGICCFCVHLHYSVLLIVN